MYRITHRLSPGKKLHWRLLALGHDGPGHGPDRAGSGVRGARAGTAGGAHGHATGAEPLVIAWDHEYAEADEYAHCHRGRSGYQRANDGGNADARAGADAFAVCGHQRRL